MENEELKIGDNTFIFQFPKEIVESDNSIPEILKKWNGLIKKQNKEVSKDTYTVLPQLPNHVFKNLEIKEISEFHNEQNMEVNINLTYDDINLKLKK